MNHDLDSVLGFIWSSCQSSENEDRNPPDYWLSFARRYMGVLGGEISKDMRQSYVKARPNQKPQFAPRGGFPCSDYQPITGMENDFSQTEADGDDRIDDLRHPDPTDHGAQDQKWSATREVTTNHPRLPVTKRLTQEQA